MHDEMPSSDAARPTDQYCILRPADPVAGMLTAIALESKTEELKSYEQNREKRVWRVRGVVSDHIPMIGDASTIAAPSVFKRVLLNENPLTIYLHAGGRSAIYFGLFANSQRELEFIEVRVESKLPSNAVVLARRPLNALLDVMTRNFNLPLCLQRLELLSPLDNSVLVYQVYLPQSNSIEAGPLGGIMQALPFAPYDAIYREALISSSPFYRLLCATRMYEGTASIRKWLKQRCVEQNVNERLPPDPEIGPEELLRFGFDPDFVKGIRKVQDLFHRLRDMRDAVAHFLIEREGSNQHVYLAEGAELERYSTAGAALLYYAYLTLESCRSFYTNHIETLRGSVLPMVQNRDQFIVRAADFGLE